MYFDDILITGKDDKEHISNLNAVLQKLRDHGLRLKKNKCEFMKTTMSYLDHSIDKDGLHTDAEKVHAIANAPAPKDVSELRLLLGLVNYYGRFIPDCATLLHPLNRLLRKNVKWSWDDKCEEALARVKNVLTSSEVLVHYSTERPLVLATDASAYGIGAVLSHIMPDALNCFFC